MSTPKVNLSNIDRGISILTAANTYKSRKLNEKILAEQYRNNENLTALRREMSAANEINKQILRNQLKAEEHKEAQKYYKALSFNLSETVDLIYKIDDKIVLNYVIENFYNKIKSNIIEANDKLDEIHDKSFTKQTLDKLNSIKVRSDESLKEFYSSAIFSIDELSSDFQTQQLRILDIKKPTLDENIISRSRIHLPRTLFVIILGLITFFGILLSIAGLFSGNLSITILFLLLSAPFGIPFYKLLKKESKWRKDYDAFLIVQTEKRVQFEKDKLSLEKEYEDNLQKEKEILMNHPLYNAISEINEKHPNFEHWISEITEIETSFANKWGLLNINGNKNNSSKRDDFFYDAAHIVVMHQQGSASLLQRKLKLGYNRAERLIEQLEQAAIVKPFDGSKARRVLFKDALSLEKYLETIDD